MNKQTPSSSSGTEDEADPPCTGVDSALADDTLVFAGDPAQVQTGFAMALRLMGLDAPVQDIDECKPPRRGD